MPKYRVEINFETLGKIEFPADAQLLTDMERHVYLDLAHLEPEFEPSSFIEVPEREANIYRVNNKEFETFQAVVDYAWSTYKIESFIIDESDVAQCEEACVQLSRIINDLES